MLADIGNYNHVPDLIFIFLAVLTIDVIVIFIARLGPNIFGRVINVWYDKFGLSAVLADVLVIFIGFILARYFYTDVLAPRFGWNPLLFTSVLVIIQVIHDLLFYLFVILPIPRGHNKMIDVFKDYAKEGRGKILLADAGMMIGSSFVAMAYKMLPPHITALISATVAYSLPYILHTKST